MFKLRPEHMAAFQIEADRAFEDNVIAHLRKEHASAVETLTEQELRKRVHAAISRGRQYGLRSESSLTAFVALACEIAPDFDEHPAIKAVLTDGSVPPDDRIDELLARVSNKEWDEATRLHAATWGFSRKREERT